MQSLWLIKPRLLLLLINSFQSLKLKKINLNTEIFRIKTLEETFEHQQEFQVSSKCFICIDNMYLSCLWFVKLNYRSYLICNMLVASTSRDYYVIDFFQTLKINRKRTENPQATKRASSLSSGRLIKLVAFFFKFLSLSTPPLSIIFCNLCRYAWFVL